MLTISDINNSNPILILYSSGTGGEFLTKTIAANSKTINPILHEYNVERNITNAVCVIDYGTMWKDPNDPSTWQRKFTDEQYKDIIGNGRYIIKDHPNLHFSKYHWKFLPNLKVLHLVVKKEYLYFAKLTFAKLLRRIEVSNITDEYIRQNINNTDHLSTLNAIKSWAAKYTWVWEHELHIVNTQYTSLSPIEIEHYDDVYYHVKIQGDSIAYESNVLPQYLAMIYNNYYTIPVDSLVTDSVEFWNMILPHISDLDISECIKSTNMWIEKNNAIIESFY